MYLSAPFTLQNLKKILRDDPELWGWAILGPKIAHLSWTKFFWRKPLLLLSSTYWPFSLCKIKKNSYSGFRVIRMHHFWVLNGPFAPKFFFWKKLLRSFSSNYWPISLCKILKKFLLQIQSYEDAPFLGSKWPICPNENLFRKLVNKPCSFHSCLSTCKKSKSDINLLMKYWRLNNTEISFTESYFSL